MFTIDSHPAYVLFDSGALHSFMSMGFTHIHNIPLMAIPFAYRISTPGAQLCVNTRTNIVGLVLATHLLSLVHGAAWLGMNWLRVYGVVLDLLKMFIEI